VVGSELTPTFFTEPVEAGDRRGENIRDERKGGERHPLGHDLGGLSAPLRRQQSHDRTHGYALVAINLDGIQLAVGDQAINGAPADAKRPGRRQS
jgi:hypothetical protein